MSWWVTIRKILTARGVGHVPGSNVGVLRDAMGRYSEPQSQDFAKIAAVFDEAMKELKAAGAILVDPIVIPNLNKLLDTRADEPTERADSWRTVIGTVRKAVYGASFIDSCGDRDRLPYFGRVSSQQPNDKEGSKNHDGCTDVPAGGSDPNLSPYSLARIPL
jgi:hypothetical protein